MTALLLFGSPPSSSTTIAIDHDNNLNSNAKRTVSTRISPVSQSPAACLWVSRCLVRAVGQAYPPFQWALQTIACSEHTIPTARTPFAGTCIATREYRSARDTSRFNRANVTTPTGFGFENNLPAMAYHRCSRRDGRCVSRRH